MKKIYYSYQEFIQDIKVMQKLISSDEVDTVVAISRGGLTFGHFLSESLNIRKVFSINSISYNETQKLKNIEIFGVPDLKNSKKVLVVDDIADSGRTLKSVMEKLESIYSDVDFKSATLFYSENSIYEPTYFIHKSSEWIEFFWSEDFK